MVINARPRGLSLGTWIGLAVSQHKEASCNRLLHLMMSSSSRKSCNSEWILSPFSGGTTSADERVPCCWSQWGWLLFFQSSIFLISLVSSTYFLFFSSYVDLILWALGIAISMSCACFSSLSNTMMSDLLWMASQSVRIVLSQVYCVSFCFYYSFRIIFVIRRTVTLSYSDFHDFLE